MIAAAGSGKDGRATAELARELRELVGIAASDRPAAEAMFGVADSAAVSCFRGLAAEGAPLITPGSEGRRLCLDCPSIDELTVPDETATGCWLGIALR